VHVRHLAFQVFKAIKELYQYINSFENKERRGELDQGRGSRNRVREMHARGGSAYLARSSNSKLIDDKVAHVALPYERSFFV
jgi:hypothetical protein